jgi:allene oxide cyclase
MQALFSGIGCCCGDQRTNKTFDARIPSYFQLAFWFQSALFHDHIRHCREAYLFTSFKGEKAMKKFLVLTAVVSLLVGVLAGAFFTLHATTSTAQANGQRVIHVIEHAITDTGQQFHPPNDSIGDILGFHNPVFNSANSKQVGTDNGQCTRTVATGKKEWECFWTTFLAKGQITVEGPFFDDGTDTTLTITGGTGVFLEAHGSMLLHLRNPGAAISQYDFIFMLAK